MYYTLSLTLAPGISGSAIMPLYVEWFTIVLSRAVAVILSSIYNNSLPFICSTPAMVVYNVLWSIIPQKLLPALESLDLTYNYIERIENLSVRERIPLHDASGSIEC